ncbi:MAG TPA: hypothetical protein VIU29_03300 [Candidatus Deferrimicrobiaceae bacterium]
MAGRAAALARGAFAGAALALLLGGCYIPRGVPKGGTLISAASVGEIRPGATTKDELFDRFGPPAAVLAPGETASFLPEDGRFPYARAWARPVRFDSDTVFALFPAAKVDTDPRRVYFFRKSKGDSGGLVLIFWIDFEYRTDTDRLWALVNERTRIVEDYAWRKAGGPTVFGRPR